MILWNQFFTSVSIICGSHIKHLCALHINQYEPCQRHKNVLKIHTALLIYFGFKHSQIHGQEHELFLN